MQAIFSSLCVTGHALFFLKASLAVKKISHGDTRVDPKFYIVRTVVYYEYNKVRTLQ